jgi:hypothetical protein
MDDPELVRIAIFRLLDTCNRLDSLAVRAESRAFKAWLSSSSRQLRDHERRAEAIVEAADGTDVYVQGPT